MGDGTVRRRGRHSRPELEGLEGRALMSADGAGVTAAQAGVVPLVGGATTTALLTSTAPLAPTTTTTSTSGSASTATAKPLKVFDYTTPQGARVDIRLYGVGDLTGTTVDPDGALNLRFSGTNAQTGIIAQVHGGGGRAPLRSLIHRNLPAQSLSGIGSSLLNVVNLQNFDLVPGGRINLTGGVHILMLNSVGPNTQVSLRETPPSLLPNSSSSSSSSNSVTSSSINALASAGSISGTGTTGTGTTGTGTTGTGTTGTGTTGTGTTGTGTTSTSSTSQTGTTTTSSGPSSVSSNGVTLGFLADLAGAQTLTSVGGAFIPSFTTLPSNAGALNNAGIPKPGPPPAPPGVVISINHVNGPSRDASTLGSPQLFAYDQTTDQLVRFDTATGNGTPVVNDALHGHTTSAGVALSRVNGSLVVLVSDGSTVYAYNPDTGAPVGSFSTAPLKAQGIGLTDPTRLGTFDTFTVISDPHAGTSGLGKIQAIDVTASLAAGQAKVLRDPQNGSPVVSFTSQRAFQLTGGMTGLPGSSTLFVTGAGHFDPYQPEQFQLGLSTLVPGVPSATSAGASLRESSRGPLTGNPTSAGTVVTNAQGATAPGQGSFPAGNPNNALGNIDLSLALDVGRVRDASTGRLVNEVVLYNPSTLARVSSISLNTSDVLTDLSASYRPNLAGAALVDVQGNTQSFRAEDTRGLVFNGEGYVYLMKVHNAVDTTAVGYPILHAQIPRRTDVALISSTRPVVGQRNGISVVPSIRPTGPLSLP